MQPLCASSSFGMPPEPFASNDPHLGLEPSQLRVGRARENSQQSDGQINKAEGGEISDNNSDTSDDNDDESSQPGDRVHGSHLTFATSGRTSISKNSPTGSVGPAMKLEANELDHLGSGFDDLSSSNNAPADDLEFLDSENNTTTSSESRLVSATPTLRYGLLRHTASEISNGWEYVDTQSVKSFTKSATSYGHGGNKTLQAQLMASRKLNPHVDKLFYPRGVFTSMITVELIQQRLRVTFPDKDEETISTLASQIHEFPEICGPDPEVGLGKGKGIHIRSFRRIFVLLVVLNMTASIEDFISNGVCDSDLPLDKVPISDGSTIYELCRRNESTVPIQFITDSWDPDTIENFWTKQWMTLSPFFAKRKARKSVWHYRLSSHAILPFIFKDGSAYGKKETRNHRGATAHVSRVYIHHHHYKFGKRPEFTGSFAVKRLHSPSYDDFKSEVDMLKKFSDGNKYPHLISLLVTFEQNDQYYLLFDWAAHNLKGYWEQVQPHPSATDRGTVLWFGGQCKGIARGIVDLHQYNTTSRGLNNLPVPVIFGHHGDIKEENILWFPGTQGPPDNPNRGVLKLADFGLAKFSEHNTGSLGPSVNFSATPSYRSPESDLQKNQGRSYDIWTLGILYLQTITWLLGGWPLLQEFRMKRKCRDPGWLDCEIDTFFELHPAVEETGKKRHIIKPVVTRFIDELHHNKSCTAFLHEFLKLIAEQMLIVQEPEKVRIGAMELHAELNKMMLKCKDEANNYASTADPWK